MNFKNSFRIALFGAALSAFVFTQGCSKKEDRQGLLNAAKEWLSKADELSHRNLRSHPKPSRLHSQGKSRSPASTRNDDYSPGEVLVRFRKTAGMSKSGMASRAQAISRAVRAGKFSTLDSRSGLGKITLQEGQSVTETVEALKNLPDVESAQPNYRYHALAIPETLPNDPRFGQLWGLKNTGQTVNSTGKDAPFPYSNPGTSGVDMKMPQAWSIRTDCSSVRVAVLDTGIVREQEDLRDNIVNNDENAQVDVYASDSDPTDSNGHGSHVAGTIAAVGNNGLGSTGVCWKGQILPVRVLDHNGYGFSSTISTGIRFAADHGARIINMSLGMYSEDPEVRDALVYARDKGVLAVVAAGNDGSDNDNSDPVYPCSYDLDNIVCVAAIDQKRAITWFSNYGSKSVDLAAPGQNILSTWNGNLVTFSSNDFRPEVWTRIPSTGNAAWGIGPVNGEASNSLFFPGNWDGTVLYPKSTTSTILRPFKLPGLDAGFVRFGSPYFYRMTVSHKLKPAGAIYSDYLFLKGKHGTSTDPVWSSWIDIFEGNSSSTGICIGDCTRVTYFDSLSCLGCSGNDIVLGLEVETDSKDESTGVVVQAFSLLYHDVTRSTYNVISGTSMATPHVTGLAALVWAQNPKYGYLDVIQALREGGDTHPDLKSITKWGKTANGLGSLKYLAPPSSLQASPL